LDPRNSSVQRGKPYFDGLVFHRVIPNFCKPGAMIQGGDPTATGTGGPGYDFDDEIVPELKIGPGVLAIAKAGKDEQGHGSNGGQFFILEGSASWLDGHHTIFGKCKEIEIVKKIAAAANGSEKPDQPVEMKTVTIAKQDSWL